MPLHKSFLSRYTFKVFIKIQVLPPWPNGYSVRLQTKRSPVLTLVPTKSFFFKKMYFEWISHSVTCWQEVRTFFSKIPKKNFQKKIPKKISKKKFPRKKISKKNFKKKKIQEKNFSKKTCMAGLTVFLKFLIYNENEEKNSCLDLDLNSWSITPLSTALSIRPRGIYPHMGKILCINKALRTRLVRGENALPHALV